MITNISSSDEMVPRGPGDEAAEACVVCAPKMVLSNEEEAILRTMREIKVQARPVSERLKAIQGQLAAPVDSPDNRDNWSEWEELSGRLDTLRSEWKQWEERLDQAIEQKLIALGHRELHS